jgi:hypothetical protein
MQSSLADEEFCDGLVDELYGPKTAGTISEYHSVGANPDGIPVERC